MYFDRSEVIMLDIFRYIHQILQPFLHNLKREIKNRFLGLSAFSQPGDLRSQIWKKNTGVAASRYPGTRTTFLIGFDYPHKPKHGYCFFFLVPWGHTLGSKINRVAGRVIIDTLIKCSHSFNTIRVKWKKLTFVLPKRTADSSLHRSYANPGF